MHPSAGGLVFSPKYVFNLLLKKKKYFPFSSTPSKKNTVFFSINSLLKYTYIIWCVRIENGLFEKLYILHYTNFFRKYILLWVFRMHSVHRNDF